MIRTSLHFYKMTLIEYFTANAQAGTDIACGDVMDFDCREFLCQEFPMHMAGIVSGIVEKEEAG